MSFNKGYELKKFEAHWEKLRIEYAAAGMTKEAIQKMYDYDRQQFNSERTFIERTQEFTAPAYESSEEEASPLMLRYQDAITVTDTYHETKSRFACKGFQNRACTQPRPEHGHMHRLPDAARL